MPGSASPESGAAAEAAALLDELLAAERFAEAERAQRRASANRIGWKIAQATAWLLAFGCLAYWASGSSSPVRAWLLVAVLAAYWVIRVASRSRSARAEGPA